MINFIKPYKLIEEDVSGGIHRKYINYDINFIPMIRFQHLGDVQCVKLTWLCWGINIMWRRKRCK